jgi:hypothetical protein
VATIADDLLPFFAQHRVMVVERITHELAGKPAAHLAGLDVPDTQPEPEPWPELDGRTEVTLTEAARCAPRTSAGGRPPAKRTVDKATTAGNELDVLQLILNFAQANGIDPTCTPTLGISPVHPEGAGTKRRKTRTCRWSAGDRWVRHRNRS